MFLNDLMTASLLLAQFSIVRSRALLLGDVPPFVELGGVSVAG
jgi:hypothetical protein